MMRICFEQACITSLLCCIASWLVAKWHAQTTNTIPHELGHLVSRVWTYGRIPCFRHASVSSLTQMDNIQTNFVIALSINSVRQADIETEAATWCGHLL